MVAAAPPSEPVSAETLSGRDDVSAPGKSPRGGADDHADMPGWAPPAKRPRTRRTKAVAADTRDGGGEGAPRRPPPPVDTALEPIGTDTTTEHTVVVAGDKLMADAIRSGEAHYTSALAGKHNKNLIDTVEAMEEENIGNGGGESSESAAAGASSQPSFFFPGNAFVSDALRGTLAGIGASDLKCVHRKAMLASDRCRNQNRLLISCKKMVHGHGEQTPFAAILTEKERPLVHRPPEPEDTTAAAAALPQVDDKHGRSKKKANKDSKKKGKKRKKNNKGGGGDEDMSGEDGQEEEKKRKKNTEKGLSVRAYDRDGRAYDVQLKYLSSNQGYRIIGRKWKAFLENNGLLVGGSPAPDEEPMPANGGSEHEHHHHQEPPQGAGGDVHIEVWAFRSPEVSLEEENGGLLPDHPHGALGLLFLHRRDGEVVCNNVGGAGAAEEEVHGSAAAPDGVTDEQPRLPQDGGHGGAAATRDEDDDTGAHEEVAAGDDAPRLPARDPRLVLEVMAAIFLVSMKDRYS